MVVKENQFSSFPAIINFIIGLLFLFEWNVSFTNSDLSRILNFSPQFGLFIFIVGSIFTMISTFKYLKGNIGSEDNFNF